MRLIGLGLIIAAAFTLYAMGQPLDLPPAAMVKLWQADVMSAENSQQLVDWYSPSHLIHGLLFYGLLADQRSAGRAACAR